MPSIDYSDEALDVRNEFLGVETIVYVEGDEDVLFWHEVFSRVPNSKFEIEALDGVERLAEYAEKVIAGRINAIIARDADHCRHLNHSSKTHPRILYTFGYSIENSLYTSSTLTRAVRSWCMKPSITESECNKWLCDFAMAFEPLIQLDVANAISSSGIKIIGDNCARFMMNASSSSVNRNAISNHYAATKPKIPATAVREAESKVVSDPDSIIRCMRGHFLASGAMRFISSAARKLKKKVSISNESLYAFAVSHFSSGLDSNHPHKNYYLSLAQLAWDDL